MYFGVLLLLLPMLVLFINKALLMNSSTPSFSDPV
jgi:hypothetical protein